MFFVYLDTPSTILAFFSLHDTCDLYARDEALYDEFDEFDALVKPAD